MLGPETSQLCSHKSCKKRTEVPRCSNDRGEPSVPTFVWRRPVLDCSIGRSDPEHDPSCALQLEVLNTLMLNDPSCQWHCVALREWFDYRGHICMVFEKLGPSLFDFLRKNRYKPFPLQYVQSFALQLIEVRPNPVPMQCASSGCVDAFHPTLVMQAVAYLHRLKLVHTDLKPENILLATNGYKKLPQNTRCAPGHIAVPIHGLCLLT